MTSLKKEFTEFCAKVRKQHDDYTSRVARVLFVYPIAFFLVKYTKLTPTKITVFSIISGMLSLAFLSLGGEYTVTGALLVLLYGILDGIDGVIARATGLHSKFGQWLDGVAGYVLLPLMMLSAAIGLGNYQALIIGSIASLCFPLQFSLIHYFKSEIVESNERITLSSSGKFEFLKYVYGIAPFYFLLLLGALFDKIIYVLLLFAVFGNMFWMAVLFLQYKILRKDAANDLNRRGNT
ncbi:MAG: CDP-alcohol phosphatidyltransferase family protein [Nanoarchaeota archaeon]|nr:CDP-alcohol phosphatidyltransferase family protein [Nanoarchaeota archaeon]